MIECEIQRGLDNGIETDGKLYVIGDVKFSCDTLERTYDGNKRGISCIPAGKYLCKKVEGSEAIPYPHISITNVPNRDGICIHRGNLYSHSKGCILVGMGYADINKDGQKDILNSGKTLESLLQILPETFNLTVKEANIKTNQK